jgi:hypothetical protein
MKVKIFRILGVLGFILAMGSLSACFEESYYPAYPRYSYGSPAVPYPRYYPEYVPVPHSYAYPVPRPYAYNARPYWRNHQRWEHKEHEEHEWHEHHS